MQVLCKSTNGSAEIQCCVCGQGFNVFWERLSRPDRNEALREIHGSLRAQHHKLAGPQAHPSTGFLVSEWDGRVAFPCSTILGHAPTWAF